MREKPCYPPRLDSPFSPFRNSSTSNNDPRWSLEKPERDKISNEGAQFRRPSPIDGGVPKMTQTLQQHRLQLGGDVATALTLGGRGGLGTTSLPGGPEGWHPWGPLAKDTIIRSLRTGTTAVVWRRGEPTPAASSSSWSCCPLFVVQQLIQLGLELSPLGTPSLGYERRSPGP